MKQIKEETLGQRIKTQRIRSGITQEELAERMCIPKSTISAYENDKVDIKSSVLIVLSKELDTDANYLLGLGETDSTLQELILVIKSMKNPEIKKVALTQIKALLSIDKNV